MRFKVISSRFSLLASLPPFRLFAAEPSVTGPVAQQAPLRWRSISTTTRVLRRARGLPGAPG